MSGTSGALRKRPFMFVFGAMVVASTVLMFHFRDRLGFMLDDWAFVIYRNGGGIDDYLDPHNEHISVLPILIYKAFLAVFGMTSAIPLHIASVLVFLVSVVILLIYLRPLVGEPLAVIGCGIILFLGTAWEDLLWAFQIGFSISMACGIGALIMLNRRDRFGDRMACLLLTVSMISTSLGIPFAIGALVDLALRRQDLVKRLYIVAIPLAVYAAWWLGWGHTAPSAISFDNAINAPEYVFNAFRLAVSEVTGVFKAPGTAGKVLSVAVAIGVLATAAASMFSRRKLPRAFLVAAAIGLAFWGLAALNLAPGRGYQASRYQYPGAVFLLMMLGGAFEGVKIRPRAVMAVGAVALFAIVANVDAMRDGYRDVFKPLADKGVAGLTAIDLASGTVSPGVLVGMNESDSAVVTAGAYLDAEEHYGSAGWSSSEIEDATETARARIDQVLVAALPVAGSPARSLGDQCRVVPASPDGLRSVPLRSRTFTFRPREDVFLGVRRFADSTVSGAAFGKAGSKTIVKVPADESEQPWQISFIGEGDVRVCDGGVPSPPGT